MRSALYYSFVPNNSSLAFVTVNFVKLTDFIIEIIIVPHEIPI